MEQALDFKNPDWFAEEDINIFRDAAFEFYSRECAPHAERWREQGIVDRETWNVAGKMGMLCTSMPEEYGGGGGDYRHEMIVMEEMIRAKVDGFGISLHNAIVAPYIQHYGTEEQKRNWLPRLATGELVGAIAMTEPGTGSDLQAIKTRARKSGNGYVLNGSKTFITNGGTANLIIVVSKTGEEEGAKGVSLMVVETDGAEGFKRGRNLDKIGGHAQDTSELFFEDVQLPAESLLGTEEGQGFIQLMQQLPQERLNIAVQGVATMEYALRETIAYVKDRNAFGKPLIAFQNTQFKLAECKTKTTIAKVFTYDCAAKLMKGELDVATASMAKYWVSEVENEMIDECLQLFGGYGYMNEYPIARMWTDARVQRIYGGTNEIMKLLIARTL
ncbi:MAG: acyl-CoA dehydrogenase [Robiginitomaculum sp.]|nr:MAG: acyl-CoA dehydrogenase [Robiginitomaculum sp.]